MDTPQRRQRSIIHLTPRQAERFTEALGILDDAISQIYNVEGLLREDDLEDRLRDEYGLKNLEELRDAAEKALKDYESALHNLGTVVPEAEEES